MKRIQILLFLVMTVFLSGCADSYLGIANDYYDGLEFSKAIPMYEKYLDSKKAKKDSQALFNLADCYEKTNNTLLWEKTLEKFASYPNAPNSYKVDYVNALIRNGKYEEAQEWIDAQDSIFIEPASLAKSIELIQNEKAAELDVDFYKVEQVDLGMKGSCFSPVYYKDGLVFCGESAWEGLLAPSYGWTGRGYLDMYYVPFDENGIPGEAKQLSKIMNTEIHEGPLCFTPDTTEAYFTANNYFRKGVRKEADGSNNLKLYKATLKKDKWKEHEEFFFNSDVYSTGHAAISPDGEQIIFVSDAPDGVGGTDLYRSKLDESGEWSEPENLSELNTVGDEMFPYYYTDNNGMDFLFFSSNGHPGIGGLDLYAAQMTPTGFASIQHLPSPLNSSSDDFAMILNADGNKGYFSSNRASTQGVDKIYSFEKTQIQVEILVLDKRTKEALEQVSLVFDGNREEAQETNAEGKHNFPSPPLMTYQVDLSKQYYEPSNETLEIPGALSAGEDTLKVRYTMDRSEVYVAGVVLDRETDLPIAAADVTIRGLSVETEDVKLLADENGQFFSKIFKGYSYEFMAKKETYLAGNTIVAHMQPQGEDTIDVVIYLDKIVIDKPIEVKNIYYDFDKWDIRPDAAIELDKLVKILVDNPEITIELMSHTDCRGSDAYNLTLSQKRAESAVNYIISEGIAKERIIAKGYGEKKLVNRCDDGVACSEKEHQQNRRTEFKVTKVDDSFYSKPVE